MLVGKDAADPGTGPVPRLESLRAVSAATRIHAALRAQIVAMEIPPGAALQEKQIALACGVSRTPVREALLRLADERLVDIFPQHGTFVSRISRDAVRDAMVIRQALERAAVRGAAERVDRPAIARLHACLEIQKAAHEAERIGEFHNADEDFHQQVAELSGHPNLWRVVRAEKAQVDRCRILTLPAVRRRASVMAEHRAIVDALAARDPDAAERAMARHLDRVLPSVDALAASHPELFSDAGEPERPGPPAPATKRPK
ncbi:GntR family transcriptional regulator [Aquabacter spiritensis]|uniref:GntR family transcriptional regulator n=1 Tax=Aquabacter spiritensis TaxID=933073 RepID=A0A4R3LYV2_9HYPH|nr:GntR family transcriptional regulator [Aquabacter spiritensis]TCT03897.1 GntR family transcriptional regulator [Aquabacter spiritensis]